MHAVQISGAVKDILDRLIADGVAASEADLSELAVRRLDDETQELVAAAGAGIADIEAGRFTTIASQADADALWERKGLVPWS